MYCGNCGAKIEEGAAFCSTCGAAVERGENKNTEIDNKKVGEVIALGVMIVAVVAVAAIGFRIYSYFRSLPTEEQLQLAVNNYQNGGIVTTDGTWLYYNDNGLCKMLLKDGSKQRVVSSDIMPEKMFYVGDSIFYYKSPGIYKAKNGVETDLRMSIFSENCFQTDGKNYYVTGQGNEDFGGVYSVKASNTKKSTLISDIHPTSLFLYKDYLYVLSEFDYINDEPNQNYGTWRIDKDGKNKIDMMGFCPKYMVFFEDTIYFTDEEGVICSMGLDGSNPEKYEGSYVDGGLNVSDEFLFYLSYDPVDDKSIIRRVDIRTGTDVELNQDDSSNICVIGDSIYYINGSHNYEIYKMSFGGEYNEPIY